MVGVPRPRNANTTYTAEEDGFLHGGIDITQERPYPRLFAYVAQRASALSQMVAALDDNPPAACTAAHLWTDSDRICPQGAIFLPVPRGTSYQAVLLGRAGPGDGRSRRERRAELDASDRRIRIAGID